MNTKEKPSTSFTLDDLQELAEAEQAVDTAAAVKVSEEELVSEEAAEVASADHRQLKSQFNI